MKVSKSEEGMTLLQFLSKHYPDLSKRKLKEGIDEGTCLVNNRILRKGSAPLFSGDQVTFNIAKHQDVAFDSGRVLFDSVDFLAYNKPAGLVCSLENFPADLRLIHRLDRMTTGVLLLAKNSLFFERMIALFKLRQVKKTYLAVVDGIMSEEAGMIENRLAKIGERGGRPIWGSSPDGEMAITEWEVVSHGNAATLVRCFPITGRTHQLRVHLSELGHPILGDRHYGDRFHCQAKISSMLLHARKIAFEEFDIQAPIPDEFRQQLEQLRLSTHPL